MINNKKGYNANLFGFFFIFMIVTAIFFFGTFVMHYLLYDYGLLQAEEVASGILAADGQAMTNIQTLNSSFLGLDLYYDILFLVMIISAFMESTIAAIKTRESGFLSFFGFVTIGNVFLIFILSYAVQIQGWFMNEIVFNILLINISTPIMTMFFNYGIYIGVLWYLWLLAVNQVNFGGLKERFNSIFTKRGNQTEDLDLRGGQFEE